MINILRKLLLLFVCFWGILGEEVCTAFASGGISIAPGTDYQINNDFTFDKTDSNDDFHYAYLFQSSSADFNTTAVTFKNDFTLFGKVPCSGNHEIYGFRIGTADTSDENTSLVLKGAAVTLDFVEAFGTKVHGLALTNNSHDNANPLKNSVLIDNLAISMRDGVKAKLEVAAIAVKGVKKEGDTEGTTNTFKGNTLNIYVENGYNVDTSKDEKGYAVGIYSQGDILSSLFEYTDTINIVAKGTGENTASYGVFIPTANGATALDDIHIVDLFAKEIIIRAEAEEVSPSVQLGHGAGVFISGNNPGNNNNSLGRTATDIGIKRDWEKAEDDFIGSIIDIADNVSIYGSGNAVYSEHPNTWVTIGAKESIILVSDVKSTVVADSGARIVLFGNSYVEAKGSDKKIANALLASNNYLGYPGMPYNKVENPESRLQLIQGNHTIIGDITAIDGGRINIHEGRHTITGNIYALGNLVQQGTYRGQFDATVDIANKGGTLTGKADTFYRYEDNVTHRVIEKTAFEDDRNPGNFYSGLEPGKIHLSFAGNAAWNMTDRSFVTELSMQDSTVHLNYGRSGSDKGRGLFIEKLDCSDGTSGYFDMTLNGTDKSKSDMLYIKESINFASAAASGYAVNINLSNSDLSVLENGEHIRYATVQGDDLKNALQGKVVSAGHGVLNITFETGFEVYDPSDSANAGYNGDSSSDLNKPGNAFVNDEFKNNSYNLYISKANTDSGTFSNSAEAMFDLSRFSYIQIIQPDRLNKRVGDVFNLGSEEDGFWFRTNYDDLGIEGVSSESIAFQGGYDKLYQHDDFSVRFGFSGRYTRSDINFTASGGYGEIQASQASLYATYVDGNDWFLDVTARYGYLVNESFLKTESGYNFASDYDNRFQGVSLEAGRRFYLYNGIMHDFYFAPQALLTYLHINGVDYTTNQDSHIAISDINSLISRLGAKVGYVYNDMYQIALKWDWFKEWNAEQHFSMTDLTTGGMPVHHDIEADVSWYDVGITVQANPKDNVAVYFDAERLFGGFYTNSYRFSAGVRITF